MVVLDLRALEPGKRRVPLGAVRVNLGNLDRRDVCIVRDDFLQRGVRRCRRSQASERKRDAGLAFPIHRRMFELRKRLRKLPHNSRKQVPDFSG